MPRITTIQNPAFSPDAAVPILRSHAAVLFKRDLPYRFLNLVNCKCKVPAATGDRSSSKYREQAFLRKLSKGKMDPLDTMLALVRLSGDKDYKPFSDLTKISVHQARRMLDNLEAHGELEMALTDQIQKRKTQSKEKGTVLSDPQKDYLTHLRQLRTNHKSLVEELMQRAKFKNDKIELREDEGKRPRLDRALDAGWEAVPKGADPNDLLEGALLEQKDRRRALYGSAGQKKFADDLDIVKDRFQNHQVIATDALTKILTRAMRDVGMSDPAKSAQRCVAQFSEIPKHSQAALLSSLLEAMADVIDGVGSARHDLKQVLREVRGAAQETQRNKQYEREAYEELNALPKEEKINLMARVDEVQSSVNMPFMQTALRNMANVAVLDTIDEYCKHYQDGDLDGMLVKIGALDRNRLAIIAQFFDRFPWIPPLFEHLAELNNKIRPLSVIINTLDVVSHERLGLAIVPYSTEDHKSDFRHYEEIAIRTGNSWGALYTFFGVPDEPAELPG
jgi:hypothetical protein